MQKMVSYCVLKEADYVRIMDFMNETHRIMLDMAKSNGRLVDLCIERSAFKSQDEKAKYMFDFHDARRTNFVLENIDDISKMILRETVRKFVEVDLGI